MQKSHRTTEGTVLLLASAILVLGFLLVFLAKLPQLKTSGTVDINDARPSEIAAATGLDSTVSRLIGRYSAARAGFSNTDELRDIRLLSRVQAGALIRLDSSVDITKLSSADLSRRAGLKTAVAEQLVGYLADKPEGYRANLRDLRRIRLISSETLQRIDSKLRVRDFDRVVLLFWLYSFLLIAGFFAYHFLLKRSAPNADPFILPIVMVLCGLSCMILFSIKDPLRDAMVFPDQVQGILLGLCAAAIPLTRRFEGFRPWRYSYLFALASLFLTGFLLIFGSGPGGVKISLFGFQPVEITKLALLFFVAGYLTDRWSILSDKSGPKRLVSIPQLRDIGPLVVMFLVSLATFLLVRDLGPMLILFGMFVTMLYVATGRPWYVAAGLSAISLSGLIAFAARLGVFRTRVDMWLHPWGNSHPNGMQLGESLWGFGSGGVWGSGLGLGHPALMSRAGSDLIFSSLGEELGLVGSLVILALFSVLIARGFRTAVRAKSDFNRFLASGIAIMFGIQTIVIVYGVLGLIPLTGVTLPFMSYGKSSIIASFFMVGLLLKISSNCSRTTDASNYEFVKSIRRVASGVLVLLLGVSGLGRLIWIQGVKSDQIAGNTIQTPDADGYFRSHINPRLRAIEAMIPRGKIYDRNGVLLADSGSKAEDRDALQQDRRYPGGPAFSHIVGYVDPRCGGPIGLEKSRNSELRGFEDYSSLLPIYRWESLLGRRLPKGKDVRLTIDARLQEKVRAALVKFAGSIRDRRTGERKHKAAAVVLDVATGEVLASVSIPDFNPNDLTYTLWKSYNCDRDHEAVLVDRVINGVYPPGSTFKLVTAAAALENGFDPKYNCRHEESKIRWKSNGHTYSRKHITDLEEMRPHGLTDLAKAIRVSCNVFFAHLGIDLGSEKLYDMARKFGLSRIAPPKRLAEDLPDNGYGQGVIEVTPLEMARIAASIANNGRMMKPHFVKDVSLEGTPVEKAKPEESGRPLSRQSAETLRRMMADVTARGTARGVFDGLRVSVAGKTGSAENDHADRMPHSWFVGFAPVHDPRIAFAVVVENGGYGRDAAGPVAREIVKSALE